MNIDLTGRTALVTGSTRGIGRAIAETLAGAGARVAVVGRDAGRAEEVARAIGHDAAGFACDVTDVASVTALIESVEKAFGQIDILVNNAGLTRDNILFRLKDEDWDTVLDANLRGAFFAIRAASRPTTATRAPAAASVSAMARPMPRVLPVTSAVRPLRSIFTRSPRRGAHRRRHPSRSSGPWRRGRSSSRAP